MTRTSWAECTVAPEAGGSGEGPLGPSGEMTTQGPEPGGRGLDRPGAWGPGRAHKRDGGRASGGRVTGPEREAGLAASPRRKPLLTGKLEAHSVCPRLPVLPG